MLPRSTVLVIAAIVQVSCFGQDTFIHTGQEGPTAIGNWSRVLVDSSAMATAEVALNSRFPDTPPGSVPNHGVGRSAHWHRFLVHNASSDPELALFIPYSEIEDIQLFEVTKSVPVLIGRNGRATPWNERTDGDHEYVFRLQVPPGATAEFLLRTHGFKAIHVPMMISSRSAFTRSRANRNLAIGTFIGIMLVLALYNLFVHLSIRDNSYLLYVLYILAICCAQLTLLGFGPFEMVKGDPWLGARSSIIFALISVLFGLAFARRFMNTGELLPKLDRLGALFPVLISFDIVLLLVIDPWSAYSFAQAITGLSALYLMVLSVKALRKGSRQARFFILAWSAFLLGVMAFVLKDAQVLPFNNLTQYAMPVGSAIEGILLSFGLADRINVLRREKEASQAQALAASVENERIIREQNMILETKVKERTQALQASNEDLKRTQTQLVNAEKMASLGQLTAGIAHEINNPINFITSNVAPLRRNIEDIISIMEGYRSVDAERAAEQLAELRDRAERLGLDESIAELDDIIASIAEGSSRTAEIVRGLRNFSRLDENDLKNADMNVGVRSTLTVLAPQYRNQVEFDLDLGELPMVECYPGKVNQVFMNILTNAVQATLARTDLHDRIVRIRTNTLDNAVCISISDNGVGMTEEVKARMFDPFFTTKAVGEGTGLGMAIVYGIIQDHHGRIEVDSMPGAGSEFRIILPIRQQDIQLKRA